jgi:aspartate dehydrogenase
MVARDSLRVAFLGYGAVGQEAVRLAGEQTGAAIVPVGALVRDPAKSRPPGSPRIVTTLEALLAEGPEVVVEVAGHDGLRAHGPAILRAGHDLILVSVGALAEPVVERELLDAARAGGAQAKVASGAIGALDAIAAAAVDGLTRVTHTARKPPATLLDPAAAALLTAPREIFRGSARAGALRFPESINVAAAVALAGIGLDRTEVRVVADPAVERNQHEVVAEGRFGTLRFAIENVPSRANARSARLVAMSIVRTLLLRRSPLVIG